MHQTRHRPLHHRLEIVVTHYPIQRYNLSQTAAFTAPEIIASAITASATTAITAIIAASAALLTRAHIVEKALLLQAAEAIASMQLFYQRLCFLLVDQLGRHKKLKHPVSAPNRATKVVDKQCHGDGNQDT